MTRRAAERRAQGLPDKVTDPVALARIAALLAPRPAARRRLIPSDALAELVERAS